MTLDEAIKHIEKIAEENQRIVDTGILFDNVTIDMLYCDDTEVIEEHLANYQKCAERHRQFAEWLKELKQLREQTKTGHWIQTQEKDDAEPFILWECSECHKEFRSIVHKVSNYCPNCGVKMVEVENAN